MRIILSLLIAVAFVLPAFADDTSQADWNKNLGGANGIREYVAGHNHSYEEYDPEYEAGIGVDLIIFRDQGDRALVPDVVTVENKWDFSNENGAVYVVASYDLSSLWQK